MAIANIKSTVVARKLLIGSPLLLTQAFPSASVTNLAASVRNVTIEALSKLRKF
jgi:hypothetical protein